MGTPDVDHFVRLETQVWQALADGDGAADGDLLTAEFLGVYPSGFADRSTHVAQLESGPTVAAFELSEARLMVLSDTLVLLAYRAALRRPGTPDDAEPEHVYISSLWRDRDGRWANVFSQDTPADT